MVVEEAKLLYRKEHSPDLKQGRKSIYLGDFEERSLPHLILIFFTVHHSDSQHITVHAITPTPNILPYTPSLRLPTYYRTRHYSDSQHITVQAITRTSDILPYKPSLRLPTYYRTGHHSDSQH